MEDRRTLEICMSKKNIGHVIQNKQNKKAMMKLLVL